MVTATGEIKEYLRNAQTGDSANWKPITNGDKIAWHKQLCEYMTRWVDEHRHGSEDTWTRNRHPKEDV
jgi:hypothetical protein